MTYVIEGIDPDPYLHLHDRSDAELAECGIVRVRADAPHSAPCRFSLVDAKPGESLLLLNHESRGGHGPYTTRHAIYVREAATHSARYVDEIPPVMVRRVLSLRGFDSEGMMVDALIAQPGEADAGLRQMFENPMVTEIDVHNATRGCFSARARRLS